MQTSSIFNSGNNSYFTYQFESLNFVFYYYINNFNPDSQNLEFLSSNIVSVNDDVQVQNIKVCYTSSKK